MSAPEPISRIIAADLIEGYGADDIALRHGIPSGEVRREIDRLRQIGALRGIVQAASQRQRGAN